MHYDQKALYEFFKEFMENKDGIEVTEEDLLFAWRQADSEAGYSKSFNTTGE